MLTPKRWSNFRFREIVEEYVHSERNRQILIRKYCDKRTIGQLAEEFELSETGIKNIIYKEGLTVFSIMAEEKPKDD